MKTKIDILIKGNLIVNNELLTMGGGVQPHYLQGGRDGSSTVNSFNNPDMYTTSTSSIYGGMTLAAYNGTKQICINTTSFSGSVAASGSF